MAINPTPFSPKATKKKTNSLYIMLGVALFLGLMAAFGIFQFLNKTQKQTKEFAKTQAIVVAAREIMAGASIVKEDLTLTEVPIQTVPVGSVGNPDVLIGRITKGSIPTNDVISESKLVSAGAGGGLTGIIPPGQRAITIMVNDVTGVGGFVKPGDRVDILAIWREKRIESTGNPDDPANFKEYPVSNVILHNVLVIATGDQIYDPGMAAEPIAMVVPQVTLALDTISAEKLALASSSSQIQLLLRSNGDAAIAQALPITEDDVYRVNIATADTQEDASKALAPMEVIDIIIGDKRTSFVY